MGVPDTTALTGRRILVADEDPAVVTFVVQTLRRDGYAVFHAYDGLSAVELALALDRCDLIISNTKVDGMPGIALIRHLRQRMPTLPVVYIANIGRSTPEIERQLPADVPILREPFTPDELRSRVSELLDGKAPIPQEHDHWNQSRLVKKRAR
jgi:two-component system response regulator GlrR